MAASRVGGTLVHFLQATTEQGFDGFDGLELLILQAGIAATAIWLAMLAVLWLASRPRFPDAGPATNELGPEPPAIANLLVNRWAVTRVAMAATLVDLAARRVLGLEDYAGGRHVVRIRANQPEGERFTAYEQQVLDLVRARATGNSSPVEALDLGQAKEAENWWKRFEREVRKDAQSRGLARGRWTSRDRTLLSGGLAVALGLVGLAFAIAKVGDEPGDEGVDPWAWLVFAGIGWALATGWFARSGALRETPAGREVCARWLGVREYLRRSATFGGVPPGSVAVWERYLAYATGFGLAHATARALPFATDDPNTAWSRYGGEWRQIRISYPKRWGFGQPPFQVFLYGLGITAFWGVIGFLILPALARGAWEIGKDVISDQELGGRAELVLGLGIGAAVVIMGAQVVYRLIDGAGKLVLGAMDLGRTVTVTGEVANVHLGRIAVADGMSEHTRAWTPPPTSPGLTRGQVIRATMSPRLCHVTRVELLDSGAREPAPEAGEAGIAAPVRTGSAALTAESLSQLLGFQLTPAPGGGDSPAATDIDDGAGAFMRTFTVGDDGMLRVFMSSALGPAAGLLGVLGRFSGHNRVAVGSRDATWAGDRILSVNVNGRVLGVEVELPQLEPAQRQAAAVAIAEHVLRQRAPTTGTGGVEQPAP